MACSRQLTVHAFAWPARWQVNKTDCEQSPHAMLLLLQVPLTPHPFRLYVQSHAPGADLHITHSVVVEATRRRMLDD